MNITKQRRREIDAMFAAMQYGLDQCEINPNDPDCRRYLDRYLETLRDALRSVGYTHDADFIDRELKLPHNERCDLWDSLESTAMDFDEFVDELYKGHRQSLRNMLDKEADHGNQETD